MGCDIHLLIEFFDQKTQKWSHKCWDNLPTLGLLRNYYLFSYLADVRNNYGYESEDIIHPLSLPRGLPSDISVEAKNIISTYGDIHSCTYYNIEELLNIKWETVTLRSFAYIPASEINVHLDKCNIFDDNYQLVNYIYQHDTIKYVNFSLWRKYSPKNQEQLKNAGNIIIKVPYQRKVLLQNPSVKELLDITNKIHLTSTTARLIIFFDN